MLSQIKKEECGFAASSPHFYTLYSCFPISLSKPFFCLYSSSLWYM
nr:MAG TPA: hypothetical protein [Caudoviricetes sp.]